MFFFFLLIESYLLVQWDSPASLPSPVLEHFFYVNWENVFQANKLSLPAVLAHMCSPYIAGFIAFSSMSEFSGKETAT